MEYLRFLRCNVLPYYRKNPEIEPIPILSTTENLANQTKITSSSKILPDPAPNNFTGREYTMTSVGLSGPPVAVFVPPDVKLILKNDTRSITLDSAGYVVLASNERNFTSFAFSRADWRTRRLNICNGEPGTWEGFKMILPHSDDCDGFVTEWCQSNMEDPICNCIREQPGVRAKFPTASAAVTCLGEKCGDEGYRTREMMAEKCDINYCLAFANDVAQASSTRTVDIVCGQQTYAPSLVSSEMVAPTDPAAKHAAVPLITYILLGAAFLAYAVLMYVIVSPRPKRRRSA